MAGTRAQTIAERAALGAGQAPWASILTCADSRLAPEIIFNAGLGDIFVARVAGNVADPAETASLEYARGVGLAAHRGDGSLVVRCSAIHDRRGKREENAEPGFGASRCSDHAGRQKRQRKAGQRTRQRNQSERSGHVYHLQANALLKELGSQGKLRIVGAYYDLASGKVSLLT